MRKLFTRVLSFLLVLSAILGSLAPVNAVGSGSASGSGGIGVYMEGFDFIPMTAKINSKTSYAVKNANEDYKIEVEFNYPKKDKDGRTIEGLELQWQEVLYQCGVNNNFISTYSIYADGKLIVDNYALSECAIDIVAKKDLQKEYHGQTTYVMGTVFRAINIPKQLSGKKIKVVFSLDKTSVSSLKPYDHLSFLEAMKKAYGSYKKEYRFGLIQRGSDAGTKYTNGNKNSYKKAYNEFLKKKVTASEPKYGGIVPLSGQSNIVSITKGNITQVNPTKVTLNKSSLTLNTGSSSVLKPTVSPNNATNKNVTWKSSNTNVATVDMDGKVTGKSKGTATITATTVDGNKSATCKVTVKDSTVIKLDKTTAVVGTKKVGKYTNTLQLKATVTGTNNTKVTWTSSNPKVAKVDSNGKVTGVSDPSHLATTVTITAKTADGKTATCKVTVEDPISAFVRRLYKHCFNRNPDKGGFNYWTKDLRSKKITAAEAVQGFFESNEMNNLKTNNSNFLEKCYLVMMDRKSDAGGKKWWLNNMANGMSRREVLQGFVESNEFIKICKDFNIARGNIKK